MPKTKIKKDKHGLYVRTDGIIYRPYKTSMVGSPYVTRNYGDSILLEGDKVSVKPISCNKYCEVLVVGFTVEYWHFHGECLGKKSSECWIPLVDKMIKTAL